MPDLPPVVAIVAELLAVAAPKHCFRHRSSSASAVVGDSLSFFLRLGTARTKSIGIASAIWPGVETLPISALARLFHGPDAEGAAHTGTALIAGVGGNPSTENGGASIGGPCFKTGSSSGPLR